MMNQEQTRKDVDECAGCGKKGDQHKGKAQIRWVGCDFCERWFVKECAPRGEKTQMMRCRWDMQESTRKNGTDGAGRMAGSET